MQSQKDSLSTPSSPIRLRGLHIVMICGLFVLSSCGDCTCSGNTTTPSTPGEDTDKASFIQSDVTQMSARMMALVRIQELDLIESQTKVFISPTPEDRDTLTHELSFYQIIKEHLGEDAMSTLRRNGNVDIGWLRRKEDSDVRVLSEVQPDWFIVLPVASRDSFLQRPEIELLEQDLARINTRKEPLWVSTAAIAYDRGITSDQGDHVVLANSADAAQHAIALINMHGRAQTIHVQMSLWPSRLGVTGRWKLFSEELAQRLSAAGHGLLPARVGLINAEIHALRTLSKEENWPEPIQMHMEYKIREGQPKALRATAYIDAKQPGMEKFASLHEALQPSKGGYPPMPRTPGDTTISMRIDRSELDDIFEVFVPSTVQLMMAAKGEESMTALRGVLSNLLDHNRGATTISLYTQNHPLSAELFVGWEAMDLEALPAQARLFNENLVKNLWAPLHLVSPSDISQVETVKLDAQPKLTAERITFEISAPKGPVDLGVCWTIFDGQYLAYFGESPCDALNAQVMEKPTAQPATVKATFDLTDVLNVFYTSPGRSLSAQVGQRSNPITVNGYARAFEGRDRFIFETELSDGAMIRGFLNDFDALESLWNPNRELELTDILQRVSLEQALYQEPGFSFIGPPGIASGAPPAMFLGLPFSLPPAPPSQLKEAFTGEAPAPPNTTP